MRKRSPEFSLEYQVTGAGWARATVTDGTREVTLHISFLSDALRDLTEAAIVLQRGALSAVFTWLGEPAEYRWSVDRQGDDLKITISQPETSPDEVLFSGRCTLGRFSGQVLTQLWHIVGEMGVEGFKEHWESHDFPFDQYESLEALVKRRTHKR